ncbi:hypothetical protein HAX54_044494 [Datura stramonium]|uniref:Uncharacterized protein n=1 Tax=Datura stramonium TaxID=4076 RepID=A0ABS8SPP3_DATST|nr:hypothetical protein [Datura stramonium]
MVDISAETINRMLYGPEFTPPVSVYEFEYQICFRTIQHLPALMDDMEARVNDRIKGLTMPELARAEEEMRSRVGGASFSSTPRVEGYITWAIVSLEFSTLITLPPATEATPPDPLSTTVATTTIIEVPEAAPPQTVVPDSGA